MTATYRSRSAETWARAREDYLSGLTAEAVCRRYDLGLSAFRRRAREEEWRRADQDDPAPGVNDLDIFDDVETEDQIDLARLRFNEALVAGRSTEAARRRRLWTTLCRDRDTINAEFFRGLTREQIQQHWADDIRRRAALAEDAPEPRVLPPGQAENLHEVHSKNCLAASEAAPP